MGRLVAMVGRVGRLAMRPASREVWFTIDRIADLNREELIAAGIRGVLLDVDGTLVPHLQRPFPVEVKQTVTDLGSTGLLVAIYSNAEDVESLRELGVPVVSGIARKPAISGFRAAMSQAFLVIEPHEVVMVGDNFISDGGAVDAGLRFIHCRPLPGSEPPLHRWSRALLGRLFGGRT